MSHRNLALLSGGVGGARMARAMVAAGFDPHVIVNVGDDTEIHGVHVSADVDTVTYTLAGIEGPNGWGIAGDTWTLMVNLDSLGLDTSFRLGDKDYANCLARTAMLRSGASLSEAVAWLTDLLDVPCPVTPATDDRLRTIVHTAGGERLAFQEYFVTRHHTDTVQSLEFEGAEAAGAAPGVIDAITTADLVVIAPSNPPLSIWPILAIDEIRAAVTAHPRVIAVSPLFEGRATKGPAADVMASLGLGSGTSAVLQAYEGVIDGLVVDQSDAADEALSNGEVEVVAMSTDLARHGTELADGLIERWS